MSAVEKLQAARDLVARPDGWTQGAYARDSAGTELRVGNDGRAVCWCATGALDAVGYLGNGVDILHRVVRAVTITSWNDASGRTQAEVVAAFDKAIELARAAP